MATNQIHKPGQVRRVTLSHPTAVSSGQPCRLGSRTGVALTDEGEHVTGQTTVDFGPGTYDLSVKGEDDDGNTAVAAGDPLYYVDADINDGSGTLSKKDSGRFFGYAMEAVTSGSTATIEVQAEPSLGPGTLDIGEVVGTAELVDLAVTTAKLAADAVDGSKLADNAVDSEHYTDGSIDEEHLADDILTGDEVAVLADAATTGGIPVLHRIDTAGGATGDTDVVLDDKTRVIDVWVVNNAAGTASDTITVKNGSTAITDAIDISGGDKTIARAGEIDDAQHEIAAAGTLKVTETDGGGSDSPATTVYVLGVKVA